VPSEPEESGYAQKIKLKSYPLIERAAMSCGPIWGRPEAPPEPEFEFATVPLKQTFTSKRLQECNWLQAMEGGIDSSHVSFLHRGDLPRSAVQGLAGNKYNMQDSQAGVRGGRDRPAASTSARAATPRTALLLAHHAVGHALLHDGAARGDHPMHGHFWVPIDDHNCWAWSFDYHPTRR
jgi:phthalate 4,5-dioxygenase